IASAGTLGMPVEPITVPTPVAGLMVSKFPRTASVPNNVPSPGAALASWVTPRVHTSIIKNATQSMWHVGCMMLWSGKRKPIDLVNVSIGPPHRDRRHHSTGVHYTKSTMTIYPKQSYDTSGSE